MAGTRPHRLQRLLRSLTFNPNDMGTDWRVFSRGWLDLPNPPGASFWSLYGDCRSETGDRESREEAVTITSARDDGG